MPTLRNLPVLAVLLLALVASCVDGGPFQPAPRPGATLAVKPTLARGTLTAGAQAINRIRVLVRQVPGNALLGTTTLDVDPSADEWPVTVEFPLPDDPSVEVILDILLINVAGGVETVEFSGRLGPISVTAGSSNQIQEVEVVRGPLENLSVTSVTILPSALPPLFTEDTTRLQAVVTTSDAGLTPVVFWTSLTPAVASVDNSGLVTAVAPGVAGIVAGAGSQADTVQVTVVERPRDADIRVTKAIDRTAALEGDTVLFTVTVANLGPAGATAVQVRDSLPALLGFLSAQTTAGSFDGVQGIWVLATLPAGRTDTLRVRARVVPGSALSTLTNTAWVLPRAGQPDPQAANDTARASVSVGEHRADLAVAKVVDAGSAFEGDTVRFTITVTNRGPQPATGSRVEDRFPEGLELVDAIVGQGGYEAATGLWSVGSLAVGASATLRLRGRIASPAGVRLTNVARSLGGAQVDPDASNDADSVSVVVGQRLADIALDKSVDVSAPFEGDTVTFTVAVSNGGPQAASEVQVVDVLPAGLTLVSSTPDRGSFAAATGTWTVGALEVGGSGTLLLRARVDSGTVAQRLVNVANAVSITETDANPGNNGDTASVVVDRKLADVRVAKTVDNATPFEGDTVTFVVAVSNQGPRTATGVQVRDTLPTGLTYISHVVTGGTYAASTGLWSVGNLTAGAADTLRIRARAESGGAGQTLWNVARSLALTSEVDPVPTNDADSASVSLRGIDLALAKTVDAPTPDVADTVTFTVTLTNNGPNTATGVTVRDTLPTGLTFFSATPSAGSYVASTGIWSVASLASGANATLTLRTVVATGTAGQTLTNTASAAGADQTDTNPANDAASASVTVTAVDLALAKGVNDATPDEGQTVTFTVTLTNNGPSAATGVSVTDALPAGLTFASATPSAGSYNSSSGVWTVGSLASAASATLSLSATVAAGRAGQTLTNTATLTGADQADTNAANNAASAAVTVTAIDLALAKGVNDATPDEGQTVTFTVTLTNGGPDAATGVSVTDQLPAGLTFVSSAPSVGSYNSSTGVWTVGGLASGASATLSLAATVGAGRATQTLTNTAIVSARDQADTNAANDTASVSVTVTAIDLALAKSVNDATPDEGQTLTYVITVANGGPDAATGVSVTDALPAGLTFVSVTPSSGSYNASTGVWTVGGLASGATATLNLFASVNAGTAAQTITNTAVRTASDQKDTNAANDTASVSVTVTAIDLALSKGVSPAAPDVADTVTYTVTISNAGPDAATGVAVDDVLPAGLTFASASPTVGSYNSSTGVWTVGSLASGASASLFLAATVNAGTAGQTITNTASVAASDQADTTAANNSASVAVTVTAVDLAVAKAVDDNTPNEGQAVAFTITLLNNGPNAATGVTVTDLLPAGLTYSDDAPSAGTAYNSTTGVWTVGSLASGASATLSLFALVDGGRATQTLTNTASVTTVDQEDPNLANNSASASVTVNVSPQDLSYGTPGNTQMIAGAFTPPSTPHMSHANGVLAGTPGLTVTSTGTFASRRGGTVVMEADGDFSYVPPAGVIQPDTFTYTVDTGASATVQVLLSGMIWYVNNTAGAGGTGVSNNPYSTLGAAAAASTVGERIYVHAGDGTTTGYGTGIFLKDSQTLEGEGVALVVGPDTLFPAGSPPHLRDPGTSPAVTMANNNTVRGILVDAPGGTGIGATAVTGGTIDQVRIRQTGGSGLVLSGASGTFTVTALHVDSAGGAAVFVSGGNATISVDVAAGSILNAGGPVLSISGTTGGSVSFTGGDIVDTGGTGIVVQNNAGTVTVQNAVFVTTSADTAFVAMNNTGAVTFDSLDLRTTGMPALWAQTNSNLSLAGTVNTTGGPGLFVNNSTLSLAFDTVIVNNPGPFGTAISLEGNSGTTAIGFLDATNAGSGQAVYLYETGTVQVTDATSRVTGTGGMAILVSGEGGVTTLDVTLDSIASTAAGGNGVSLSFAAGSLAIAGGVITGASSGAFAVQNSSANVSYAGSINNTAGNSVYAENNTGGNLTFSGPISDVGGGIFLSTNTGTVTSFTGGLTLNTSGSVPFTALNAGTVNVTGGGNTINTDTTGLSVQNTTIGASGITFQSITAQAPASPVNGILLSGTGSTGTFSVTGTGSSGSGGLISGASADGVSLTNVDGVSLSWMTIQFSGGHGIGGSGVTDLTLDHMVITGNGDAFSEAGINIAGLAGSSAITNSTVSNSSGNNVRVTVPSVALTLDLTASSFDTGGSAGFEILTTGTGTATVTADGSSFDGNSGSGFLAGGFDNAALSLIVRNTSTFNDNSSHGFELFDSASAAFAVDVTGSTFSSNGASGLSLFANPTTTTTAGFTGVIDGNTFSDHGLGYGVYLQLRGAAKNVVQVTNNTGNIPVSDGGGFLRTDLGTFSGTDGATLDLTIDGNAITFDPGGGDTAMPLSATALTTMCLAFGGSNTVDFANTFSTGVFGEQANSATFNVAGLGASTFDAFIAGRLTSTNAGNATEASSAGGSVFTNVASCQTPP